jgi:histidyl-tRNA synthetase
MRYAATAAPRLALLLTSAATYRTPPALNVRFAAVTTSRRGFAVAQEAKGGRASAAVVQAEKAAHAEDDGAAQKAMDLNPPRGTRDFYPEEMALRNWLFGKWRDVAAAHGFEEYDAPVLETEDLYIRKAGEDVTKQLYSLQDQSGRRLSLRPEMTPSLARMVLARKSALPLPLKWFSIPQCWRYERMTRGRRREHYQWNLDVWGVPGLTAEVELLAAAVSFMKSVGLTAADVSHTPQWDPTLTHRSRHPNGTPP